MDIIHMIDVIALLDLPSPSSGRASYNIPCPCCDTGGNKKHLNINLRKDVYRCPRCGFSGGVFDLYAYYSGINRDQVRDALIARLDVQGPIPKKPSAEPIEEDDCPLTDVDTLNETYTALLSKLSLASDHRNNLKDRGLPDQAIAALGYKTTPVIGMDSLARQLLDEGHYLSGVPGFFRKADGRWTFISESRGILIPVRDLRGRIQGLQIRRDNMTRRKYRWVSTVNRKDGCKAVSWVHLAGPPKENILITEGPLKADIIHYFTGQTVLAVAGVNSLSLLGSALDDLRELGTRKVMTAFDMDFLSNPHVQGGYQKLTAMLCSSGMQYGTYLWDPAYNGLDDYIWKCQKQGKIS